jgi:hypothetical protein
MLKIDPCVVKDCYIIIFVIDQDLIAVGIWKLLGPWEENSTEQRQYNCLAPEARDMTVSLD